MYLIYVDEYGTSGGPLDNPREPYFSLTATLISEKDWVSLESDIIKLQQEAIGHFFNLGLPITERFELHAAEMMQGKKAFKGFPIELQMEFAERLIALPKKYRAKFLSIDIEKKVLRDVLLMIERITEKWPKESKANMLAAYKNRLSPYSVCFCMLIALINRWLISQVERGILIFDENNQYQKFASLSSYGLSRISDSTISNIIAAPFYVDSKVHTPLQLSDMIGYLVGRQRVAQLRGEEVRPPIVTEWLEKYYVPHFLDVQANVTGAEFSATFLAILEEMWPIEFPSEAEGKLFAELTQTVVSLFSAEALVKDDEKNIGDETPEGLAPMT